MDDPVVCIFAVSVASLYDVAALACPCARLDSFPGFPGFGESGLVLVSGSVRQSFMNDESWRSESAVEYSSKKHARQTWVTRSNNPLEHSPDRGAPLKTMDPRTPGEDGLSVRWLVITEKNAGQRLDNFLTGLMRQVPKSKIYNIIRKGEVRINKKRCKPDSRLELGDEVRVPPVFGVNGVKKAPPVSQSLHSYLDNAVLYEDESVIAVNKPAGLAVHGGSGVSAGLIEAMRQRLGKHVFLELVHRLDRDTSGCILLAKTRPALKHLHAQFREDKVNKTYHLVVYGKWAKHTTHVDAPLRKNELQSGERMVIVAQDGKPSRTNFRILAQNASFSLMEAKPITGRTHQIRVHAAFVGHAILGDPKYFPKQQVPELELPSGRLMLHARQISLALPSGKLLTVDCPYDQAFSDNVEFLELSE